MAADAHVAAVRAWWRVRRPGAPLGQRLDPAYRVAVPTGLHGAALVAVASASATGRRIVLWSGPWGWALQPVAGTTGASLLALALLGSVTALAVAAAARGFEHCPTERHAVRAEARSGAMASAW